MPFTTTAIHLIPSNKVIGWSDATFARAAAGQISTPRLLVVGGTATSNSPPVSVTQTWNSGGVTFNGLLVNITDSASASGSLIANLQVGGTTLFSVAKTGHINVANGKFLTATNGTVLVDGDYFLAGSSQGGISWTDSSIRYDAANSIGLRNSTNPQTWSVYNTYTSGSNYERGVLTWSSNTFVVGTQAATGTLRSTRISGATLQLYSGASPSLRFTLDGSGHFLPSSNGSQDLGGGSNSLRRAYTVLINGVVTGSGAPTTGEFPNDKDWGVYKDGSSIVIAYNDGGNVITIDGGGIDNVVEDTSPQLGANLDVNTFSLVSTSNGNITLAPNGTGKTVLSGANLTSSAANQGILRLTQTLNDGSGIGGESWRGIDLDITSTDTTGWDSTSFLEFRDDSVTKFRVDLAGDTIITNADTSNVPQLVISQTGTGDAGIRLALGTTTSFAIGVDNSDGDALRFTSTNSGSANIGAGTDCMWINSNGLVRLPGGFHTGSTTTESNIHVLAGNSFSTAITGASNQLLSADVCSRIHSNGSTASIITNNAAYATVLLAASAASEGASGTHPIVSQLAIKPLALTNGTATTTNGATLYVEGATTGATPTNNYSVWVDSGETRLDGILNLFPFGSSSGNTTAIKFYELAANGTHNVSFQAPDSLAGSTAYILPTAFPDEDGYILSSTTAGILSWIEAPEGSGGGDPPVVTGDSPFVDEGAGVWRFDDTSLDYIKWGGSTSSYPALRRDNGDVSWIKADDSAFADMGANLYNIYTDQATNQGSVITLAASIDEIEEANINMLQVYHDGANIAGVEVINDGTDLTNFNAGGMRFNAPSFEFNTWEKGTGTRVAPIFGVFPQSGLEAGVNVHNDTFGMFRDTGDDSVALAVKSNDNTYNFVIPLTKLTNTYTVTNGTTDRTYNANATSIDELADILATLIADLKAVKIIP